MAMYRDFAGLIEWLARQHHPKPGGEPNYYAMARTLRISSALPYQWKNGTIRQPTRGHLERISTVYGISMEELMRVCWGLGRGAAVLALVIGLTCGSVHAAPPDVVAPHPEKEYYVGFCRVLRNLVHYWLGLTLLHTLRFSFA